MKTKHVVMAVLAVLVLVLIIQNSVTVPVNFFFWPMAMPLFFLVLGVLAAGLVIGYLAAKVDRKKKAKGISGPVKPAEKTGPSVLPEASAPVNPPPSRDK